MKLTTSGDPLKAMVIDCVAHRCLDHQAIPPLNMNEGNGSSECGVCAAEEWGTRLAEQALDKVESDVILPILDAYADRLTHHAELRQLLGIARDRLNLASPGAGDFLNDAL